MKTNPRKRPATQADVDRARREGQVEGLRLCEALYLLTLCDKHPEVDANAVRTEVGDLAKSTDARYMTAADVRTVLREEYGIDLMAGPSKAIAHGLREEADP